MSPVFSERKREREEPEGRWVNQEKKERNVREHLFLGTRKEKRSLKRSIVAQWEGGGGSESNPTGEGEKKK